MSWEQALRYGEKGKASRCPLVIGNLRPAAVGPCSTLSWSVKLQVTARWGSLAAWSVGGDPGWEWSIRPVGQLEGLAPGQVKEQSVANQELRAVDGGLGDGPVSGGVSGRGKDQWDDGLGCGTREPTGQRHRASLWPSGFCVKKEGPQHLVHPPAAHHRLLPFFALMHHLHTFSSSRSATAHCLRLCILPASQTSLSLFPDIH